MHIGIGAPVFAGRSIRLSLCVYQTPDRVDPVAADTVGKEAGVADAMQAEPRDVDQEPVDELEHGQAHDLLPVPALDAVVLLAEGHGAGIRTDQTVARDRHPVGVPA